MPNSFLLAAPQHVRMQALVLHYYVEDSELDWIGA